MFAAIPAALLSRLDRKGTLWPVLLSVLVMGGLGAAETAIAQPNPVLSNGTDCADVIANAQSDRTDPDGPSGIDNWGATGACAVTVNQEGWGYDYQHAYFWVQPTGGGNVDLYICTELFGHPGDSDADGGYVSNNAAACGAYPPTCSGFEGTSGIIGPSEEITIQIFPDCTSNALISFTLTNDVLFVTQNSMGAGPPFLTVLGTQGQVWQASPLVPNGADSAGTQACLDPTTRRGAVVFRIQNFNDFFAARPDLSPFVFDWKVLGGHSADQLSEDSVEGEMRQSPGIEIVKETGDLTLCTTDGQNSFSLAVTNTGATALFNVTVRDTLPAGFVFDAFSGLCEFDNTSVLGNVITLVADTLYLGQTRTCAFDVTTSDCSGLTCNPVSVVGDVLHPCFEAGIQASDVDTSCVTCFVPDVAIAARDTSACVGEVVQVPIVVTNQGPDIADLFLECFVDGVPRAPVVFANVPGGGVRNTNLSITCAAPDTALVFCRVTGTVDAVPGCSDRDSVTVEVICNQAVVDVDVNPDDAELIGCGGDEPALVPIEVVNLSTTDANLSLACSLNGVPVNPPAVLDNPFAPGERETVYVAVPCTTPGITPISCVLTGALVSDPDCTDNDADADTSVCAEAEALVEVIPGASGMATCVDQTIQVPVKVTNLSSHDATLTLTCSVKGIAQPPAVLDNPFAPGEMDTVYLPVTCTVEELVAIDCSVAAALVINPACVDTAADSDTVTCLQAAVEVEVDDAEACVGTTANVPVRVINTSGGAENITLNCKVGGIAQTPVIFTNVAAGDTAFSSLPVTCTIPGQVAVSCSAHAELVSNPACTDDDTDEGTVTCRQALVDITLTDDSACAGDTARVSVLVENESGEPANISVSCTIDGIPVSGGPQSFPNVEGGGQRSFFVNVACGDAGNADVICAADLSLVSLPTCTATDRDTADALCNVAAVTIDVQAVATCVGATVQVPVIVQNQSSGDAILIVTATVKGAPAPVTGLGNPFIPGAVDTGYVSVTCAVEETVEVAASVNAYLASDETCTDAASDTADVTCLLATVEVEVDDAEACVGTTANVPVRVINTSGGAENITLNCKVGGVAQTPVIFTNVAAGDTAFTSLPVTCTVPGQVAVSCSAHAELVSNAACTDDDTDEGTVTCRQALVDITLTDASSCAGDTVRVPVLVENESGEPANISVTCTIGGVPVPGGPQSFPNVETAGQRSFFVNVACGDAGISQVVCTADLSLVSVPTCTDSESDTATATCTEADVTIDVQAVTTCVGRTVQVPVIVQSLSSGDAVLSVSCSVNGGAPGSVPGLSNPFTPGERDTVYVDVLCTEVETVEVKCTVSAYLSANETCTATASDSADVNCVEASVDVEVESASACVNPSQSAVDVQVINTSQGIEDITLFCSVEGVPRTPVLFNNVAPGDTVETSLSYTCTTEDSLQLTCEARASLDSSPTCTAVDRDTASVSCTQACVELVVGDAKACVGDTVYVPVLVSNCADEPSTVYLVCTVDGSTVRDTLTAMPGGTSEGLSVPVFCQTGGTHDIRCTATAHLVSLPTCTDADADTGRATCVEPCVTINVGGGGQIPPDSTVNIPVTVGNCGPDTANIVVLCVADGDSTWTTYQNVPGLGNRTFQIPVRCESANDTTSIVCSAALTIPGLPGCGAEASDSTRVFCRPCVPCVDILVPEGQACVGATVDINFCVKNCEVTEPTNMFVDVYVDGVLVFSRFYRNASPGQQFCDILWFMCGEDAGVSIIEVVVDAWKVNDPSCRGVVRETFEYMCREACAEIVVSDAAACTGDGGGQSQVPVKVTNCSNEPADITVTTRIDNAAPRPVIKFMNMAAGEMRTFTVPTLCRVTGPVHVVCTATAKLKSLAICTFTDADTGSVVCMQPACELTAENQAICLGEESLLPLTVRNTSTGPEDFTLAYTVEGVAQTPITLTALAGGHSQIVYLPVLVTEPGQALVVVDATVRPTGDAGCVVFDNMTVQVSGQVLAVSMAGDDVTYCASQGVNLPMSVTNTSTMPATITLGYTFDGVTHDPVVYQNVPPGQSASMSMTVPPGDPAVRSLTCTVTAQLAGSASCTILREGTLLVIGQECATTEVTPRTIDRVALAAYPNPIALGATTIVYAVPEQHAGRHVELTIYDVAGRVVRHLASGSREQGEYSMSWDLRADDGTSVAAGVYFSHLLVGPEKKTQRLLVIR